MSASPTVALRNAVRHGREYRAEVFVDGELVGRAERGWSQGGYRANEYVARVDSLAVATGRTLADLRDELREWAEERAR